MDKETCIDHKKQQSCPKVHWEYTKGTKPGEGPKTGAHRRRNSIRSISINGRRCVKEPEIKEGLVGAFQSLLSASSNWCPPLPDLRFNMIGVDQVSKLEEMFTEKEILAAISGLNGDKAPGPDGFPLAF